MYTGFEDELLIIPILIVLLTTIMFEQTNWKEIHCILININYGTGAL